MAVTSGYRGATTDLPRIVVVAVFFEGLRGKLAEEGSPPRNGTRSGSPASAPEARVSRAASSAI
jgi:hypothetical protein